MIGDEPGTGLHPVVGGLDELDDGVGGLLDLSLLALDPAGARVALTKLSRVRARFDALTMEVAAHADRVGAGLDSGAASTGAWWAHATAQTRGAAGGQVKLGRALDEDWHQVAAGCAAGRVNVEQARAVVHALDDLPDDLDPAVVAKAEAHLVELARDHDAADLRILGRAILETLAPDVAEDHERKKLEVEERRARERTRLTLSRDGHGSVYGRFCVPEAHGAMFEKALWALASPRHRAAVETHDDTPGERGFVGRPAPKQLGEAFCELIESLTAKDLPQAGGTDATVLVTIPYDRLVDGLGTATLDTGERITAATARRMACEAGLIPVVLGGDSQPLDVGRERRFHTRAMRYAANLRDGGCTAEGCDRPPGMCHLHHEDPWHQGGTTTLAQSRLLCPHHHRRIHDPDYQTTRLGTGKVTFHRRV